jgi:hypothetical protein
MITRQYCARSRRHDSAQLLDGEDVPQVVQRRSQVVRAVRPRSELRIPPGLADLLNATMQVTDDGVSLDDRFALERQHDPQHTVRRRMLRTHIQH